MPTQQDSLQSGPGGPATSRTGGPARAGLPADRTSDTGDGEVGSAPRSGLAEPEMVARLRDRSVRELIAELARLEEAFHLGSSSSRDSDPDRDREWVRAEERRVIAELRRRHLALRRAGKAGPGRAGAARVWQVGVADDWGVW